MAPKTIKKITGKTSLLKLTGMLSAKSADILEKSVAEVRKRSISRRKRMAL